MKKLLLLSLIVAAFSLRIAAQSSDVTFFNQEGQKFYVIVNGIKQNDSPQTNVKVTGLTAQNYKVKIIFNNASIPAIDKTIFTKDADGKYSSVTYVIKQDNKGNWVARMNSMQENTNVVTTGQYDQPLLIEERPVTTTQVTTTSVSTNTNNGGGISVSAIDPNTGQAVNMNVSVNANGMNTNAGVTGVTTTTTTTTTSSSSSNGVVYSDNGQVPNDNHANGHYIMQGYNGNVGCPWPMNANDFQAAKNSIASKSFEDSKLTIAKQIVGANCLFCSQVRDIMNLFSFESTKLDFAKFAFSHVYDQGNYFKLNDAFTFESSIDELNTYINGNK